MTNMAGKGRQPDGYRKEFDEMLLDFFDREPFFLRQVHHYDRDGNIKWIDKTRVANKLPTLRDFAKTIDIKPWRVYAWVNKDHGSFQESFLAAYDHARALREDFIIQQGLLNLTNPVFTKFVAVNLTTLRDKADSNLEISTPTDPDKIAEAMRKRAAALRDLQSGRVPDGICTN